MQGIRHPKPSPQQAAAKLQSSEGMLNHTIVRGEMTEGPVSDYVWNNIPSYRLVGVSVACKYAGSTWYVDDGPHLAEVRKRWPLWTGKAGENGQSF